MPNIRIGRHTRRWTMVAVIVVVFAGAGGTAWAVTRPSGPAYRTATVTRANVTQTLLSTGTIEPVSQANVSFPVSGQVASVGVGLGSHVSAGQVLARLTTTALAAQVSAAQYAVATATVRLAADQASQTTTTAFVTTNPSTASSTAGSGSKSTTASGLAAITSDQAALRTAQQRLDAQLTAAKSLLTAETSLCATAPAPASGPAGPTSPSTTPTPTPSATQSTPPAAPTHSAPPTSSVTPTSSATATTTATAMALFAGPASAPASGSQPATCQAAITDVMSAQEGIATAEQSLATSESDLTNLLSAAASAAAKSAGSSSTGGSGGTGAAGGSARGGTSGASAAPATAAQLAADQASLDSANAQLSVARQNMAAATLVAPIAGTVALVNITPGQQVTGSQGSGTTADFVIEGAGGEEATTTVSVSDVGEIRVGQPASVTLDGSATSISGQVVAVGMLSTVSSTGSASDPVTIGLAAGAPTLFAGSDAQVAIILAQVSDAVTVPTSAVEGTGAATFVTVLQAGKPVRVRVVVGAIGPVLTQVSSGLTVGEQVVLADMSTPLPTNTNPFAARGLTGGGGGFGGGRAGTGTGGGRTTTGSAGG